MGHVVRSTADDANYDMKSVSGSEVRNLISPPPRTFSDGKYVLQFAFTY